MKRRTAVKLAIALPLAGLIRQPEAHEADAKPIVINEEEWFDRLSYRQYSILFMGEQEEAGSSSLLAEQRPGVYRCVGCDLVLFRSEWKLDGHRDWPSFRKVMPGHLEVSNDALNMLGPVPYRCARCGGYHGQVYNTGPEPEDKRYSNNGAVLVFEPDA